jgi:hypothetical protein
MSMNFLRRMFTFATALSLALSPMIINASPATSAAPISPKPVIASPVAGAVLTTVTPFVSGTGVAGAAITGNCTTIVHADGSWSCLSRELGRKTGLISMYQTIVGGRRSLVAQIRVSAPAVVGTVVPQILWPAAGGTTGKTKPSFAGTGTAPTVDVFDANEVSLCTATVAPDGTWGCTSSTSMPDGVVSVHATATTAAGVTGTTQPHVFTVLSISSRVDSPITLTPKEGARGNNDRPDVSGVGENGTTVRVTRGVDTLCTAAVTNNVWRCTVSKALPDGPNALVATASDATGGSSLPSADRTITIDPKISPVVTPTLTTPNPGLSTTNNRPMFSGTGPLFATIQVLDSAVVTVCDADVAISGEWACVPATPLPDGVTVVTAVATDPFGNVSAPTAPLSFTITDPGTALDTDGDGVVDSIDTDDDGDGATDIAEGGGLIDTDGDGIVDSVDSDSDNDGRTDRSEGTTDSDGDGLVDAIDPTAIFDLQVSSSGASSPAGITTAFGLTIANNGPDSAAAGTFSLTLPPEVRPLSAEFESVGSFLLSAPVALPACTVTSQTITCERPALAVNTAVTYRVTAKFAAPATAGVSFAATASVTILGDGFDTNTANNSVQIPLRVLSSQLPATL